MPRVLCFTFAILGTDRRKDGEEGARGAGMGGQGRGGGCLVVMLDGRRFFVPFAFLRFAYVPCFHFFLSVLCCLFFVLIMCILDIMCLAPCYFPL